MLFPCRVVGSLGVHPATSGEARSVVSQKWSFPTDLFRESSHGPGTSTGAWDSLWKLFNQFSWLKLTYERLCQQITSAFALAPTNQRIPFSGPMKTPGQVAASHLPNSNRPFNLLVFHMLV